MLILYETPAGFALLKLLDEMKLSESEENLTRHFDTVEAANFVVQLIEFENFSEIGTAVKSVLASIEGQLPEPVEALLQKLDDPEEEILLVADNVLAMAIMEKFEITCRCDEKVLQLMRCIRSQIDGLLGPSLQQDMKRLSFSLAQNISAQKIQHNPDIVDTMISSAIRVHDEIEQNVKKYMTGCKKWYGNHFPELNNIIPDSMTYIKVVQVMGNRSNADRADFNSILSQEMEINVKAAAQKSIGSDISVEEFPLLKSLTDQIIDLTDWKVELQGYLDLRMAAIAPNLTTLVGSLIGARLISKAGSLLKLSKKPASTISLYGAEKAMFAALRGNHFTPKYGLIYNSPIVLQANAKNRGKVCKSLSCKIALAARIDSFSEASSVDHGNKYISQMETRLKDLARVRDRITIEIENPQIPQPLEIETTEEYRTISVKNIRGSNKNCFSSSNKRSYEKSVRNNFRISIDCGRKRKGESFGKEEIPFKRIKFCNVEEILPAPVPVSLPITQPIPVLVQGLTWF